MKVKVNNNSNVCIHKSEAVTVPSLTMMISTVSEESFARDTHTQPHVDTHTHTYISGMILRT